MPYTALVALVKVEVYGGAVNDVALFEQLHDLRVFGIAELRLEIIQLADGLVVQIALAVTLQERHCQLVHRIVGPFLPSADPCLQEVDQPGGGHVGPFVKAFYPIAFHLEAEVSPPAPSSRAGRPGAWLRTPA